MGFMRLFSLSPATHLPYSIILTRLFHIGKSQMYNQRMSDGLSHASHTSSAHSASDLESMVGTLKSALGSLAELLRGIEVLDKDMELHIREHPKLTRGELTSRGFRGRRRR